MFGRLQRYFSSSSRLCSTKYNGARVDSDISTQRGLTRRLFKPHETYEPKDLNQQNAEFYLKAKLNAPKDDVFKILKINPLDMYKNVKLLSHFVTEMGHIKPRTETGLGIVNQKRLGKAIKRAQAMGLMPYTHKMHFPNGDNV
ncbi:mitochondrial 37S ribosomal protein RSM18 [Obelidium mucronatum]|nr:mitochondrial 37S ribosomal protein RSM18 [Obelidium mucronatum]